MEHNIKTKFHSCRTEGAIDQSISKSTSHRVSWSYSYFWVKTALLSGHKPLCYRPPFSKKKKKKTLLIVQREREPGWKTEHRKGNFPFPISAADARKFFRYFCFCLWCLRVLVFVMGKVWKKIERGSSPVIFHHISFVGQGEGGDTVISITMRRTVRIVVSNNTFINAVHYHNIYCIACGNHSLHSNDFAIGSAKKEKGN